MSIATDSIDGSVVVSAAAGDETAFAQIIARYDDDLARVAYLVTAEVGLAHEAVQAAWPIAWRKIGSLRDLDRLRPWLVAIAVNEARQLLSWVQGPALTSAAPTQMVEAASRIGWRRWPTTQG